MPSKFPEEPLRIDVLCTGLDRIRRGYESFARECFDALRGDARLQVQLLKGSGNVAEGERSLWCAHREAGLAKILAKLSRRSPYHVEQLTFFLSYLAGPLRTHAPRVVLTSDANLANFLSRWRRRSGGSFKIVYSNGGPISPPFPEYDHVQQVAGPYYEEARAAGEPEGKHSLVPYGIHIPDHLIRGEFAAPSECRAKLGLPNDRKIVLSVGNVSSYHKRMDHVVREVAIIPASQRPFLVLLGHQDHSTEAIRQLGKQLLGEDNFRIASAPYGEVTDYYGAADVFILASLREGFGRVLLEASAHGLPCIVDDNSVMHYVLGNEGFFVDMRTQGTLAAQIMELLASSLPRVARMRRVEDIHRRFSWEMLADRYVAMFRATAGS